MRPLYPQTLTEGPEQARGPGGSTACSLHPHLRHPVGATMSLSVHSQHGKPAHSLAAGLGEGKANRHGAGPPRKLGRHRLHSPQGNQRH